MALVDTLTFTIVEKYSFDREKALAFGRQVFPGFREEWMDDDAFIVALFEHLNGSPAVDAVFWHDANPQVDVSLSQEEDDETVGQSAPSSSAGRPSTHGDV